MTCEGPRVLQVLKQRAWPGGSGTPSSSRATSSQMDVFSRCLRTNTVWNNSHMLHVGKSEVNAQHRVNRDSMSLSVRSSPVPSFDA
eukprot:4611458-Amphidinium_carterae.1